MYIHIYLDISICLYISAPSGGVGCCSGVGGCLPVRRNRLAGGSGTGSPGKSIISTFTSPEGGLIEIHILPMKKNNPDTPGSNASHAAMAISAATSANAIASSAAVATAVVRSTSTTAAVYPMYCEEQTYTTRIYTYIYIYIYTATYAIRPRSARTKLGVCGIGVIRGCTVWAAGRGWAPTGVEGGGWTVTGSRGGGCTRRGVCTGYRGNTVAIVRRAGGGITWKRGGTGCMYVCLLWYRRRYKRRDRWSCGPLWRPDLWCYLRPSHRRCSKQGFDFTCATNCIVQGFDVT